MGTVLPIKTIHAEFKIGNHIHIYICIRRAYFILIIRNDISVALAKHNRTTRFPNQIVWLTYGQPLNAEHHRHISETNSTIIVYMLRCENYNQTHPANASPHFCLMRQTHTHIRKYIYIYVGVSHTNRWRIIIISVPQQMCGPTPAKYDCSAKASLLCKVRAN